MVRLAADQGDATAQFNLSDVLQRLQRPSRATGLRRSNEVVPLGGGSMRSRSKPRFDVYAAKACHRTMQKRTWSLVAAASGYAVAAELLDPTPVNSRPTK